MPWQGPLRVIRVDWVSDESPLGPRFRTCEAAVIGNGAVATRALVMSGSWWTDQWVCSQVVNLPHLAVHETRGRCVDSVPAVRPGFSSAQSLGHRSCKATRQGRTASI